MHNELFAHPLDHFAAFILSNVNGNKIADNFANEIIYVEATSMKLCMKTNAEDQHQNTSVFVVSPRFPDDSLIYSS